MVVYLHNNGCKSDIKSYKEAINSSHLNILKFLHENQYKYKKSEIMEIAKRNCLKYIRKNI